MQFEFEIKEIRVLKKLVEQELEDINPEIRHSSTSRMRDQLREERQILKGLLAGLCAAEDGRPSMKAA